MSHTAHVRTNVTNFISLTLLIPLFRLLDEAQWDNFHIHRQRCINSNRKHHRLCLSAVYCEKILKSFAKILSSKVCDWHSFIRGRHEENVLSKLPHPPLSDISDCFSQASINPTFRSKHYHISNHENARSVVPNSALADISRISVTANQNSVFVISLPSFSRLLLFADWTFVYVKIFTNTNVPEETTMENF